MVKSVKLWLLAAILASGALDIRASDDSMNFLKGEAASSSSTGVTPEVPVQALAKPSAPVTTSTLPAALDSTAAGVSGVVPMTNGEKLTHLVGGVHRIEEAVGGIAQKVGAAKPNVQVAKPGLTTKAVDKAPSFLAQHPNLKTSLIVGGVVVGAVVTGWAAIKIYHMSRAWLYDIQKRLEIVSGSQEKGLVDRKAYFKLHKMYATSSNWGGISRSFQHVLESPYDISTTDQEALKCRLTEDVMNELIFVTGIDNNNAVVDIVGNTKMLTEGSFKAIKAAIIKEQDEFLGDMKKLQKYFTLKALPEPAAESVAVTAAGSVAVTAAVPAAVTAAGSVAHYMGRNWIWKLASRAKAGLNAVAASLLSRKVDDTRAISALYETRLVELGLGLMQNQILGSSAGHGSGAVVADADGAPAAPEKPKVSILANLILLTKDQIAELEIAFLDLVVGGGANNEYAKLYFRAAMAYVRLEALGERIDKILREIKQKIKQQQTSE